METIELNLPTPVLLVWGLPEDARAFHIEDNKLFYLSDFMGLRDIRAFRNIPDGNWQLISKLSELTEEDCCKIVDVSIHSGLSAHYTKGVNPTNIYCYKDSLESFHSAIEAEGHLVVNPIGEKPELKYSDYSFGEEGASENLLESIHEDYEQELSKWQDAQSKTLPENTLIFKRL